MDATHGLDKDAVKSAIAADPPGFYGPLLDGELRRDGSGRMKAACPFHADADPSLTVFADGTFHCFGCGEHGDGLDFLGKRLGLDFPDALREAAGRLGLAAQPRAAQRTPATRYKITDEAGELVAEHCRQDLPGGEKTFWWQRNGARGLGGLPTADLPLYNLPALLAAEPGVLVVLAEGEKATDALTAAGQLAVGTVCGAKVTPSDAALRPLVGRIVALWPDADEPGETHMAAIAARLQALGCEPFRVTWADAPEKGDAADFMATHSADELQDLLATAKPMAGTPTPGLLLPLSFAELESVVSEASWAWPGYLPNGALTILFAPPEGGKSYVGLDLMRCVATGADWPDGSPNEYPPGRCLLVDFEGTQAEYLDRARACGVPLEMLYTQPPDALPYLTDARSFDVLREWLRHTDARLLVLDSWRDAAPGVNEDSSGEVAPTVQPLKIIARDFDIPVLMHHHPTKQPGKAWQMSMADARGSGAFAAAARVMLGIDRPNANSEARLLRVLKRNSGPKPDPLGFEIGDSGIVWTEPEFRRRATPKADAARKAVREALQRAPLSHKDLHAALDLAGVARRTGDEALTLMRELGQITVGADGRYGLVSHLAAVS